MSRNIYFIINPFSLFFKTDGGDPRFKIKLSAVVRNCACGVSEMKDNIAESLV